MTGPEHYRLAEDMLSRARTVLAMPHATAEDLAWMPVLIALGHAHAQLAAAAALHDGLRAEGTPATFGHRPPATNGQRGGHT